MSLPRRGLRRATRAAPGAVQKGPRRATPPGAPPARRSTASGTATLTLQPGRERSLVRRHPWVFSGAVASVAGDPGSGDTVAIRSADGQFLGWGAFSPKSQIVARVWSFDERAPISATWIADMIRQAVERRTRLFPVQERGAIRLIHGESDGLPGVVADRFADWVVVQLASAGAWKWREAIADAITAATGIGRIFERSDMEVLALEGLPVRSEPLRGGEPPALVRFEEGGLSFEADLRTGHKTGFYLDQRDNRAWLRELARGREVLDAFCYTGGFTRNAVAGGAAHVTAADRSGEALGAARRQLAQDPAAGGIVEFVDADIFALLRQYRDQGRRFDLVVLDPPKFAPTAAQAASAARGYKDINLWALRLLRPGGLLMTFSCSGGVSRDLFHKIVAGSAADARVDARVLRHLGAAADHPVSLAFPEGEYLKGLLCEVG